MSRQVQQPGVAGTEDEGYVAPDSTVLERLIESTRSGQNPLQDQGQEQQQDQPLFGGEQQN
jgi:hypothetical protein